MSTEQRTRYRVDRNGFGATVRIAYLNPIKPTEGSWLVGSCQAPPLGTAEEMSRYQTFITTVVNVCNLLNCTAPLTEAEQAYIRSYCK